MDSEKVLKSAPETATAPRGQSDPQNKPAPADGQIHAQAHDVGVEAVARALDQVV